MFKTRAWLQQALCGRSRSISFLLPVVLCACTSLDRSDGQSQIADVPAQWSTAPASAGSHADTRETLEIAWWNRFGDPVLTSMVTRAMDGNTSVASGAAALRQARALRDVAAASLWPRLDGAVSAQHTTSGLKSSERRESNLVEAGLDASWTLDVFGANRQAVDAETAVAWASNATLGDTRVQIAAEIGVDYILLRSAQARLVIARSNLTSQRETLQIAQWREQAGLSGSVETQQARASAEQTSANLPLLQTSIDQTSHALAVLTGQPPGALTEILSASGPVPHASETLALSLPADTLRQRADVRAAEYRMAAALSRLGQTRAAQRPNFSIGGSLGLSSLTVSALTHSASVLSSVLANIAMPVFDAGAGRARVEAQKAAYDQAAQSYRGTVLGALQSVEDALVALRDDRARLLALTNAADAGTAAATLARQEYASGLVDFQIVLETQRTQLSTQDGMTAADAAVSADNIRLYKALGGGWRPDDLIASAGSRSKSGGWPEPRSRAPAAIRARS